MITLNRRRYNNRTYTWAVAILPDGTHKALELDPFPGVRPSHAWMILANVLLAELLESYEEVSF
jgi:hypothetical protein